MEHWVISFIVR